MSDKLQSVVKRDNGSIFVIVKMADGQLRNFELDEKDVVILRQGMDRVVRPGS